MTHLQTARSVISAARSSRLCFHVVHAMSHSGLNVGESVLERIGRPDILWSVNKLARSITNWNKVCDKRMNRLFS